MNLRQLRLWRDTRGANLVEYILLVGVIAILAIGAFNLFGGAIRDKVQEQTGEIEGIGSE